MNDDNINYITISSCNIIFNVNSYVEFNRELKRNGVFRELNYALFHTLANGHKLVASKLITTAVMINGQGNYDVRMPKNITKIPYLREIINENRRKVRSDRNVWVYSKKEHISLKPGVGLRPHQIKCAKELLDKIEKPSIGSLIASTGLGKSFLSLNTISTYGYRAAVHFIATAHLENYKKEILKFTDIKEDEIAIISGSKSLTKDYKHCKIFLIMIKTMFETFKTSLEEYGNAFETSYDYFLVKKPKKELVSQFYEKNRISLAIFDEVHRNTPSILSMLSVCNFGHVLFLTATHNRTQKKEDKILNTYIIKYSVIHEEPERHIICPLFLSLDAISEDMANYRKYKNFSIPGMNRSSVNYFKVYNDIVRDGQPLDNFANLIITKIEPLLDEINIKKVAICFSMKKDHIKKIKTKIDDYFDYDCGLLISDNNPTLDYQLSRKIILSTEKFMNAALNIDDLEAIILPIPNFHNPIMLKQILGRLRGHGTDRCIVIDIGFSDEIFRKHNNKREKYYENNSKILLDKEYEANFDTSVF